MTAVWTEEQQKAISLRKKNVLVSAAAGAGKTAVLIERIIQRILDPLIHVDIDQLLVVTFTNSAAQEIRERIAKELFEQKKNNPGNKRIQMQSMLLDKACISTIHSFCLEFVKQNYHLLELPPKTALDPRFRIIDETEASLLRAETMESVFEDLYEKEDQYFLQLVECFGGDKDDTLLQSLALKLYDYSRSDPMPGEWIKKIAESFKDQSNSPVWKNILSELGREILTSLQEVRIKLDQAIVQAIIPNGPTVYLETLQKEKDEIDQYVLKYSNALANGRFSEATEDFAELKFSNLPPCRNDGVDQDIKNKVISLRKEAKEAMGKIHKDILGRNMAVFKQEMKEMHPLMRALCDLTANFAIEYLNNKLNIDKIDFSDLEHFTLDLFRKGRIPYYSEVMVDEYQDINRVQEELLQFLAGENTKNTLFMVGDVKQSIYAFRLAEPELFITKYLAYRDFKEKNEKDERVLLKKNFRSRQEVICGINFLFERMMIPGFGKVIYDDDSRLVYGAKYPEDLKHDTFKGARLELHIIEKGKKESENESGVENFEAVLVASKIKKMLSKFVWDKGTNRYRPICYSDIVILMRSVKVEGGLLAAELEKLGIPVFAELGSGFLAAQEIQTMLALLRIIDNPRQDIPLAAVLRSALIRLDDEQLAEIRAVSLETDFYDAIRKMAYKARKNEFGKLLVSFLRQLRRWRIYARSHSIVELLWMLYKETGYYNYAGAMPKGKQRQANLRVLQDRAGQYESTGMKGLFRFLRFLEKIEEKRQDLGTANPLGEKENVVRVMSIHKSKGLEFPVVFICGLGKIFNKQDIRDEILVDRDIGLGPFWADANKRLKYPTLARLAIKYKRNREMLAEELRILYVAVSRAREKLVLIGSSADIEENFTKWIQESSYGDFCARSVFLGRAQSFLEWIGVSISDHRECEKLALMIGSDDQEIVIESEDSSSWYIKLWKRNILQDLALEKRDSSFDRRSDIPIVNSLKKSADDPDSVEARLDWQYPWKENTMLPAKLTVTELKNVYRQENVEACKLTEKNDHNIYTRPKFLSSEQGLSAQEKGTALHLAMRHLDLTRVSSKKEISEQLREMVINEKIAQVQAESIPCGKIADFFASGLGQRIINSDKVLREVPFTLMLDPWFFDAQKHQAGLEKILVQGTIDCLFEEKNGYVLVDYKTDQVDINGADLLEKRYRIQMDIYALAVEKILNKNVHQKMIYSFALGEALEVNNNFA